MFGVFQYMKTWLVTYSVGVGLSCLNVYSNTYIYIRKTTNAWYRNNKTVKKYTNLVMNCIYGLFNRISIHKIEPFYDLWLSLSYKLNNNYVEDYMNLDAENFAYYPLLDNLCISVLHKPNSSPHGERSSKCVVEEDVRSLFTIVYNQINKFNYSFYDIDLDFLILFKTIDKYVCRVGTYQRFVGEYKDNITLNKIKWYHNFRYLV